MGLVGSWRLFVIIRVAPTAEAATNGSACIECQYGYELEEAGGISPPCLPRVGLVLRPTFGLLLRRHAELGPRIPELDPAVDEAGGRYGSVCSLRR